MNPNGVEKVKTRSKHERYPGPNIYYFLENSKVLIYQLRIQSASPELCPHWPNRMIHGASISSVWRLLFFKADVFARHTFAVFILKSCTCLKLHLLKHAMCLNKCSFPALYLKMKPASNPRLIWDYSKWVLPISGDPQWTDFYIPLPKAMPTPIS